MALKGTAWLFRVRRSSGVRAPGSCMVVPGSNSSPATHGSPFGMSQSDEDIFKEGLNDCRRNWNVLVKEKFFL